MLEAVEGMAWEGVAMEDSDTCEDNLLPCAAQDLQVTEHPAVDCEHLLQWPWVGGLGSKGVVNGENGNSNAGCPLSKEYLGTVLQYFRVSQSPLG
ncbi:hypothetical protein E2C01_007606 [Portunus trituberculatus]|uniref:Uncharacterized protein n=1 Tax=Portunus trituberculatus TaxID=210409 RepID=A0A5B7CZF8_PORTR|nr:hypothetical protein [Portunus trituberculatus]